jgi:hypothetical protein
MSDRTPAPPPGAPGPGPEHAVFQKDVGTWDASIEIRMGPGEPQRSSGVATSRLACGGTWLITDFINESTGFEGHGVYGWDPRKGSYVGTWVDPMRSFLAVGEGSWDAAAKVMTFRFEAELSPGAPPMRWREVTETRDPDTQVFRSFMPGPGGSELEVMTVTYRRRR